MSSIQSFYFVGVITLVSSAHVYGQKKDKMNVLFIIADDMRPELGCYGIEDIVTPHIDRLAEQATVFQNAYCNIPVSGASRAMSGLRLRQFCSRRQRWDLAAV